MGFNSVFKGLNLYLGKYDTHKGRYVINRQAHTHPTMLQRGAEKFCLQLNKKMKEGRYLNATKK